MSDIAGIGSFTTNFVQGTPSSEHEALQQQQQHQFEEERRVTERSSIVTEDPSIADRSGSQRTELGQPQPGSPPADGGNRTSESDRNTREVDTVALSPEAQAGRQPDHVDTRPNTTDEGDETNQLSNIRNERTGNTPDDESEATRTLGQVLDVFA